MQPVRTPQDIKRLGRILGVWAHPDDEIYTCGGILAIAARNGQRVMCMTASRGEQGVQDESRWPKERLGEIRTRELEAAYRALGISEHGWFDFPDGGLSLVDESDGLAAVMQCFDQLNPDTILTFGPEGMTGHPDHQTVSAWATEVASQHGINVYHAVLTPEAYEANREADAKFNMFFNIEQPPLVAADVCDICISLDDSVLKLKCEALKSMPSQTEAMINAMGERKFCAMQQVESFRLASF